MITRLIMTTLFVWLPPKPTLAYFSQTVQLDGLDYTVQADIDPDCAPLQKVKRGLGESTPVRRDPYEISNDLFVCSHGSSAAVHGL